MIGHKYLIKLLPTIVAISAVLGCKDGNAAPALATSVAITNVSVFDSVNEQMLPPQSVVIEGDRIQAVGPSVPIPQGAQVCDGHGQFLIPGLIDAHVHLVHLSDRTHVAGEEFLPMFLGAGVTSVRSTGDAVEAEKRIARHVDQHPEICPRFFMASPLIDCDPPTHKDVGLAITKTDQAPKLVEDMKQAGCT